MAPLVNSDLKIPYEIGVFIASQVTYLDSNVKGDPWAEHEGHFNSGPNPFCGQMKQGLLLEVTNYNHKPRSIHTRYGKWVVLGNCTGSFDEVFEVVKKTLNLKKNEELSNKHISYYAIQTWNEEDLAEPIRADSRAGEFFSHERATVDYKEFKSTMSAS